MDSKKCHERAPTQASMFSSDGTTMIATAANVIQTSPSALAHAA